jgi:TPR repeat protein
MNTSYKGLCMNTVMKNRNIRLYVLAAKACRGNETAREEFVQYFHTFCVDICSGRLYEYYKLFLYQLINEGNTVAMIFLGDLHETGGIKDKNKVNRYYRMAAEKGEPYGYVLMAIRLLKQPATELDYKNAYSLLKKAEGYGGLNSDSGLYAMGDIYYLGRYVEKNNRFARHYYNGIINNDAYRDSDYYWKACYRMAEIMLEEGDIHKMGKIIKRIKSCTKGMKPEEIAKKLGTYE